MTADLDKLDPPLRDEPPDEADRRTQPFRGSWTGEGSRRSRLGLAGSLAAGGGGPARCLSG
jgi:hypothetical protein